MHQNSPFWYKNSKARWGWGGGHPLPHPHPPRRLDLCPSHQILATPLLYGYAIWAWFKYNTALSAVVQARTAYSLIYCYYYGYYCYYYYRCVEVEDDSEVAEAEREMDEVDSALHQGRRKYTIRRRHSSVGTRLIKMLNKYRMKLEFRCNGTLRDPCRWAPTDASFVL